MAHIAMTAAVSMFFAIVTVGQQAGTEKESASKQAAGEKKDPAQKTLGTSITLRGVGVEAVSEIVKSAIIPKLVQKVSSKPSPEEKITRNIKQLYQELLLLRQDRSSFQAELQGLLDKGNASRDDRDFDTLAKQIGTITRRLHTTRDLLRLTCVELDLASPTLVLRSQEYHAANELPFRTLARFLHRMQNDELAAAHAKIAENTVLLAGVIEELRPIVASRQDGRTKTLPTKP